MNINYGGAFPSLLKVGENQKMVYTKHNKGPFWMTAIDRLKTKYDLVQDESIKKDKIRIELLIELRKKVWILHHVVV